MRRAPSLFLLLIVVLSGCGDAQFTGGTPTESPSVTLSNSPTETYGPFDTADLVNKQYRNGSLSSFDVELAMDTRMENMDPNGAGDPYFVIAINGTPVVTTDVVVNDPYLKKTITVPAAKLRQFSAGTIAISLTIYDEDVGSDDKGATWTWIREFQPPSPTPTALSISPTGP